MRYALAFTVAGLGLMTAAAPAQVAKRQGPRPAPLPVEIDSFDVLSVSTLGQIIHDTDFGGFAPRGCMNDAAHTDPTFGATQWTAQAGFAEHEVMAATYTLDASQFPIKLEVIRGLFVTSNTVVTTTTEWSVMVWEGTPETGTLVASYSSDDVILPHLVMPPGNNATLIEVSVDPGDPEQIFVYDNNGSHQFSIGFRIDRHNAQTADPCVTAPPSNRNAFPATDRDGLLTATGNWLKAINCGALGCAAGWNRFSDLGICRPSGDWALAAVWSPVGCVDGFGACCLPDGTCEEMFQNDCEAVGGIYQGDGSDCSDVDCPIPTGACCFGNGFCVVLTEADCNGAGGVFAGNGTDCADANANGAADACEPTVCVADRNLDGNLDFFDIQDFLGDFSAFNASADMNGDQQYDFFDVQIYLNLFAAGCP